MSIAIDRPPVNNLPPMLSQYLNFKERYPDCLLFFQVGDFYELFFDDAVTVAQHLNLTLTSRDKNSEQPIPMCGVPVAVVDGYLDRLVEASFSVAVVSQTSAPQAGKRMVDRELDRIITPGMRLLANADNGEGSRLAALCPAEGKEAAIAFADVQSGIVEVRENISVPEFAGELSRIGAAEVLLPRSWDGSAMSRRLSWVRELEQRLPGVPVKFRPEEFFNGSERRQFANIEGYSGLSAAGKQATRLLVNFIDETTVNAVAPIRRITVQQLDEVMIIDATTRKNLELLRNLRDGSARGSLFSFIDRTGTNGGRRLLRHWLLHPSTRLQEIRQRQDALEQLRSAPEELDMLAALMRRMTDCERVAARTELGIASPREFAALRDTLDAIPELEERLRLVFSRTLAAPSELLEALRERLAVPAELLEMLTTALVDAPPQVQSEGGYIRDGFSEELDRLREIRQGGRRWMAELEARERERTGISSLKIRFNNVLGYFIEVTKANQDRVPSEYVRRQTMTNAARFVTDELKEQEEQILNAKSNQVELERRLFEELRGRVGSRVQDLRRIHSALAELDAVVALATLAEQEDYVRPEVVEEDVLFVEQGRHPIVASLLQGAFVPNGLHLQEDSPRCVLLTGPNMGGKSTYLRQAALLVILAQIGSFVPARRLVVGVVDRVFARLGASDDLSEGESTFMVEMREASHILASATRRSLVLIDEIGRGTATADGLAIAQAILEWIARRIACRALFATHYHELTRLEGVLPGVANFSVGSVDRGGEVIFTHEIEPGAASRSYGIEVARMANLPPELLQRARELLSNMPPPPSMQQSLPLFERPVVSAPPRIEPDPRLLAVAEELKRLQIDRLTPLDALNLLNRLRNDVLTDE